VTANKQTLAGITASEKAGLSDIRDVLEAEQNKLRAELSYEQTLHDLYRHRLLMRLYTGELQINEHF